MYLVQQCNVLFEPLVSAFMFNVVKLPEDQKTDAVIVIFIVSLWSIRVIGLQDHTAHSCQQSVSVSLSRSPLLLFNCH